MIKGKSKVQNIFILVNVICTIIFGYNKSSLADEMPNIKFGITKVENLRTGCLIHWEIENELDLNITDLKFRIVNLDLNDRPIERDGILMGWLKKNRPLKSYTWSNARCEDIRKIAVTEIVAEIDLKEVDKSTSKQIREKIQLISDIQNISLIDMSKLKFINQKTNELVLESEKKQLMETNDCEYNWSLITSDQMALDGIIFVVEYKSDVGNLISSDYVHFSNLEKEGKFFSNSRGNNQCSDIFEISIRKVIGLGNDGYRKEYPIEEVIKYFEITNQISKLLLTTK